eukprot:481645_1
MAEQVGFNTNPTDDNLNQGAERRRIEKDAFFTSKLWISVVVIVIVPIIAYFWKSNESTDNVDITLHCPNKIYYVQIPKNNYQINASHPEHELTNVTYKWMVTNKTPMKYIPRVKDKDKAVLKFIRLVSPGEYVLTLNMEVHAPDNRIKTEQCKVVVKFVTIPKFSIDLGTTFSCIGYRESKKITIVKMDTQRDEYCIPSAIYFPKGQDESIKVGYDALSYQLTDPINVIYDIKRIVGRRSDEKEVKEFIKT